MRTFRLRKDEPLLNIASYARGGSHAADRLTAAQVEHIRLTVNHAPEVVMKVLPGGSSDLNAVGKHLDYIGRQGDLALDGDDGERLYGRVGKALIEDWDLDIDELRPQANLTAMPSRKPPKLVHKLMFSMPPGTPPQKVLSAVRNFAREEFYGQHRYAMVLHTDEPHPHVHLVLKAISEDGARLNIKKATLRHWRSQFARHLRDLGVAANATESAVRGRSRSARKDGIYRASLRGDSTYMRTQAESVAGEVASGGVRPEPGKRSLLETRAAIQRGWQAVADKLSLQGERRLATDVVRFSGGMDQPLTDREWLAQELMATVRARQREVRTL
ncbi:MAG: relaxase/mobilization nuclease domain-containing protein [Sinobacteraceae bacterium]|nr:relaxase/mobilization nuclease domain-containing protein [Nevskiaceae bacterium]MCP5340114.1 relaxase/mobilization nuclease domain-containing protein [Nevskiaceae bacterium]MCP5360933.1 relaxase/mobilization nuclease domain-containing protein [Nevskiaceae bacterium]MCP5472465.1 relaxase/mobilization nuclease domain-containing protein [Nevskiaceae bacterium]